MRQMVVAMTLALLSGSWQQTDQIVTVPEIVTARGVPPIPQTIADGLTRYGAYRSASLLAWTPGGGMLIQTTLGNAPEIYAIDRPGGDRKQLTFYADGVSGFARYDPADPGTFVFRKDVGSGAELNQLFRLDVATGSITLLTDAKSRHGSPVWSRDGHRIAYDSTRRNGRDGDLYVMRASDAASERLVAQVDGEWKVEDWSSDGKTLLAIESLSAAEARVWSIDVGDGRKRLLTPSARTFWANPRFSSDGNYIYAIGDRGAEVPRLWRKAVEGNQWTGLTPSSEAIESFELSPDGSLAAIVFDRHASSELEILDLRSMKRRPAAALPPGIISAVAWRSNRELGFTFSSARVPGEVFSVEVPTERLTRWTTGEASFDASTLPPPTIIEWKSFDGLALSGVLYLPPAKFSGPRPVMINIHGGPHSRERPRFQGRSNYFLNELGIAIVFPNVRGSEGFGKSFGHLDDGRKREDAVKDIGALLDWIATRPDLDKAKVMVTGASYGGYLTLAAAIAYGDRIRCAFAAAAISNFVTFLDSTEPSRQQDRRAEYGNEREQSTRAFLTSISPVTRASRLRVPLMIAHGARDTRVPLNQANEMTAAAAANGTAAWSVIFADAGHDNFPGTRVNADFNFYCWILFVQRFLLA